MSSLSEARCPFGAQEQDASLPMKATDTLMIAQKIKLKNRESKKRVSQRKCDETKGKRQALFPLLLSHQSA